MTRDAQVSRHRRSRLPGFLSGGGSRCVLALPCFCPIRGRLILGAAPPSPRRSQPRLLCPRVSGRTRGFIIFQRVGSCRTVAPGSASSSLRALVWVPPPRWLVCRVRRGWGWAGRSKNESRVAVAAGGRRCTRNSGCVARKAPREPKQDGGSVGERGCEWGAQGRSPRGAMVCEGPQEAGGGVGGGPAQAACAKAPRCDPHPRPGATSWKQLLPGGTHRTGTFPAGSGVGEFRRWLEATAFDAGVSGEHSAW